MNGWCGKIKYYSMRLCILGLFLVSRGDSPKKLSVGRVLLYGCYCIVTWSDINYSVIARAMVLMSLLYNKL